MIKKLTLTLSLCLSVFTANAEPLDINKFVFKDFYQQDVTLNDYNFNFRSGLVVNVWASWCVPCVKELPTLMRLQQILPQVTVIGINVDDDINKAKNFLKKARLPESVIVNLYDKNAEQLQNLNISSLPVTLIIDRKGNILKRYDGFRNWHNEVNIAEIQNTLGFF